jgi:lipid-A-disaccharide synthase
MANISAGRALFPEFVQHQVKPAAMARALIGWLDDAERVRALRAACATLHAEMRRGAADRAAEAVLALATG